MGQKYLEAGKIVNTHGLRGEVKVAPWTDYPEVFEELDKLYLDDGTSFKIKSVKYHKSSVIVKLSGVDDVNVAERLKNKTVYVPREDMDNLADDTYFVVDLIGLEVFEDENYLDFHGVWLHVLTTKARLLNAEGKYKESMEALRQAQLHAKELDKVDFDQLHTSKVFEGIICALEPSYQTHCNLYHVNTVIVRDQEYYSHEKYYQKLVEEIKAEGIYCKDSDKETINKARYKYSRNEKSI